MEALHSPLFIFVLVFTSTPNPSFAPSERVLGSKKSTHPSPRYSNEMYGYVRRCRLQDLPSEIQILHRRVSPSHFTHVPVYTYVAYQHLPTGAVRQTRHLGRHIAQVIEGYSMSKHTEAHSIPTQAQRECKMYFLPFSTPYPAPQHTPGSQSTNSVTAPSPPPLTSTQGRCQKFGEKCATMMHGDEVHHECAIARVVFLSTQSRPRRNHASSRRRRGLRINESP